MLGIDTSNGDLAQWTAFTTGNFGNLGLNKLGANNLTLNTANTYTGKTTISGGNLILAAGASLASTEINLGTSASGQGTLTASALSGGGITIGSGQTLSGYGTVVGNTTIASGATLAPGNSPGIIDIQGDLNLLSGGTSLFEVAGLGGAGAVNGFDQVNVTGNLTYGGVLHFQISGLFGEDSAFENNILIASGLKSGNFSSVQYTFDGATYKDLTYYSAVNTWQTFDATTLGLDNNYIGFNLDTGVVTVVPEPSTCVLFGLGAMALVVAIRRRQS
jgi:autotransporter-associated beta strand protein